MGTLTPGATYIYERNGDTVYAREFGADPSTRKEIGWDYDPTNPDHLDHGVLWYVIDQLKHSISPFYRFAALIRRFTAKNYSESRPVVA